MASPSSTRIWFRSVILIALIVVLFYVGRPLYWKISATIHDIRQNKQSVRQGLLQFVQVAIGWYHDESASGIRNIYNKKSRVSASRRLLFGEDHVVRSLERMKPRPKQGQRTSSSWWFNAYLKKVEQAQGRRIYEAEAKAR